MSKTTLLLMVVVLAVVCVATTRTTIEASWLHNLASREFATQLLSTDGSCTDITPQTMAQRLARAIELHPKSASSWRTMIRLMGLSDRRWIVDNIGSTSDTQMPKDTLVGLYPGEMLSNQTWDSKRCLIAWGAWTAALVEARSGNSQESVALYQAGMEAAPGRVPPEIIREYYLVLAHYALGSEPVSTAQQLSAAKYLALGGASQEASVLFAELPVSAKLDARQRCQAAAGLTWLQAGGEATGNPAPWPAGHGDNECGSESLDEAPDWTLTQGPAVIDQQSGNELVGFDLDADILDAGAEVLGILYWKTPDGKTEKQSFRQPNLWVNSGNTWLPLQGFTQCIPGYSEPSWVTPCAGQVVSTADNQDLTNPVGKLYNAPERLADAFISTSSVPIDAGRWLLYGGHWRSDGQFPRGHVSRVSTDGRYDVVLDLSGLPLGEWQAAVGSMSPLSQSGEFSNWIWPRAEVGDGTLWFDDVFSFELPK